MNKKIYIPLLIILIIIVIIIVWFGSADWRENRARADRIQSELRENNPALLKSILEGNMRLRAILNENSNDAGSWFELGANLQNIGDYRGAEKALKRAIELDKVSLTATSNLGFLYQDKGEYEKAEEMFLELINRDATNTTGYIRLADLYEGTEYKAKQEAENILLEGLETTNRAVGILIRLMEYYEAIGNDSAASNVEAELEGRGTILAPVQVQ